MQKYAFRSKFECISGTVAPVVRSERAHRRAGENETTTKHDKDSPSAVGNGAVGRQSQTNAVNEESATTRRVSRYVVR